MYEFWGDMVFTGRVSTNSGWVQNPILLPTWYRNEGWGQSDFDSMSWKWASSHCPSMPQLAALRWGQGVLSPPLRPPWKWWEGPYVCSVVGIEIRPSHCQGHRLAPMPLVHNRSIGTMDFLLQGSGCEGVQVGSTGETVQADQNPEGLRGNLMKLCSAESSGQLIPLPWTPTQQRGLC